MLRIRMLNGASTSCNGVVVMRMTVGRKVVDADLVVAKQLVSGFDVILGLDSIQALGGVYVCGSSIQFGTLPCVGASMNSGSCDEARDGKAEACGAVVAEAPPSDLRIEEDDFSAVFRDGVWTVKWKWLASSPQLNNRCGQYAVSDSDRKSYEDQVDQWIKNGWLQVYNKDKHGTIGGLIPLMAVTQPNKPVKVRPVMDYRELNSHVKSFPGMESDVCIEKLRKWRRMGVNLCILDLKKAYLQLHIAPELQRFQVVKYHDKLYVMTRMGFGLSIAPKVMTAVLRKVLSLDDIVGSATDNYIDDIIVNQSIVSVERVRSHLQKYGLVCKEPLPLNGGRVLGLEVKIGQNGQSSWQRDNSLPPKEISSLTKRELFSLCGKLIGHYPVGGWLRVACAYLKRLAGGQWDCPVSSIILSFVKEVLEKTHISDPVRGVWSVSSSAFGVVWCDASSVALGVAIEINGAVVEDAAWLRKKDDGSHINVAELEAVIKGVNLALKWGLKKMEIQCDSATVCGWVGSVVSGIRKPKVSGLSEMIVRNRLVLLLELIDEFSLSMSIVKVPSASNLADPLTRVPKSWLGTSGEATVVEHPEVPLLCCAGQDDTSKDVCNVADIVKIHNQHHCGVEKTLHHARTVVGSHISRNVVSSVVSSCQACKSIDPASVVWEVGELNVSLSWNRLALDIVHVNREIYLSLVDCGPGRYAIWRKMQNETSGSVIAQLENIFCERGPPSEILTDNGPSFKSQEFADWLVWWKVKHLFSCAYRPTGNGIVERNHRTIKRMVGRTSGAVGRMVFWYNNLPNDAKDVPSSNVFRYDVRLPGVGAVLVPSPETNQLNINKQYQVGDAVFVRPVNASCMTRWGTGKVTKVISSTSIEVDGMLRHIRDLRLVPLSNVLPPSNSVLDGDVCIEGNGSTDGDNLPTRRSERNRRPPTYLEDYVC